MKWVTWVVCPGVGSTDANAFLFTKKLTNDDLPTLERPTKTTSGMARSGVGRSFMLRACTTHNTQQTTEGTTGDAGRSE
jgi:hypothetical protein